MTRYLKIETCTDCPFCEQSRDYTADSFETNTRWDCTQEKKNIRRYVDWTDRKKFIPDWCPLSKK